MDIDTEIEVTEEFEVTDTTMVELDQRAIPMLIITIFALSLLPAITFADIAVDDVDPMQDDYDSTIVVTGSGVTAGVDVNLYWDAVKAWDGEKGLLNSTEAGSDGTFEIWFDVPEALNGDHYIWVKDTDTGSTAMFPTPFVVDAKISLDPDSGLEGDKKIEISGYGFSEEVDIVTVTWDGAPLTISPGTPETDDLGSWTATFTVPDVGGVYGDYEIYVEDDEGVSATADFTVGASIEIDVDEGPVGTIVEVEGRGFRGTLVDAITLDGIDCGILDEDDAEIDDGEFKLEIAIPSVDDAEEEYDLEVSDNGVDSADETFEVTGLASIVLDPSYGVQGATIEIHGYNFTQISEEEVTLWIGTTEVEDFETDSKGEFEGTFTVPAVATDAYDVFAVQDDYNIVNEDEEFRVGLMIIILSEESGPTGTEVTLTGTGFSAGQDWNATMGDETIFEDETVDGDETISGTFYVPTMDVGTYTITVMDIDTEIEVTEEFEVTDTTMVELDPVVAPNEYNVSISGKFWAALEDGEIEFVLYNETDEWDLTVLQGDPGAEAVLDEDGNFTAWWEVPDDETLSLGDYTMNITDEEDLFLQVSFSVVTESVGIDSRKGTFVIGDTVSFDIVSSFEQLGSYIEIMDPHDNLYWKTDGLNTWVKVGDTRVAPYYSQNSGGNPMILIPDAPLGTWAWTWYDIDDEELDSGSFTVEAAPEAMLGEQMEALSDEFDTLSEDVKSDISGVKSDVADVASDVAGVKSDIAGVKSDLSKIDDVADTADDAKSAADSAKSAADAAKSAADEAKTAASGLTTLVYGAIGASLVAALAAIVSLMQISRRIAG
jgi:hypothetical protein